MSKERVEVHSQKIDDVLFGNDMWRASVSKEVTGNRAKVQNKDGHIVGRNSKGKQ